MPTSRAVHLPPNFGSVIISDGVGWSERRGHYMMSCTINLCSYGTRSYSSIAVVAQLQIYRRINMYVHKNERARNDHADESAHQPYRVRLPKAITDPEVGLGDALKRATAAVGIEPCGGCERRAAVLNRWLVFSGGRPKGG